jgi:hypothetical protein
MQLEERVMLSSNLVIPSFIQVRPDPKVASLTVTMPQGALNYGEPLKVKAKLVLPGSKAGIPLFVDDSPTPTATFDSGGTAAFTLLPTPGDYSHTASFDGNASFSPLETSFSYSINPAPTTLTLATSRGQTLTATLKFSRNFLPSTLSTLSGTVELYDANALIQSAPIDSTSYVNFDLTGTTPGAHDYRVNYSGSGLFSAASKTLNFVYVPPSQTAVSLYSSAPLQMGRSVTMTAAITSAASTGTILGNVLFFADGNFLGTSKVSNGKATIAYAVPSAMSASEITFSALYQSASNHLDSASPEISLPVSQKDVIDILALMSKEVMEDQSGAVSRFNQAVERTNEAFANSGIPLEIRVTAIGGTNYSESGDMETDLTRLDTPGDGVMEEVFGLRNGYGADLVVLLVSQGSFNEGEVIQGIATQLVDARSSFRSNNAFMVVNINAALSTYVLAHEIGHTLGASHAIGDPDNGGAAAYSHGYRFTGSDGRLYHDIMAYYPGQIVAGFSNPSLTVAGVPFGNAQSANASRVIRENAPVVAAYRNAKPSATIDTASATQIKGYALDPRLAGALTVRVDVDKQSGVPFLADDPYGTIQHGYTYLLPALTKGKHTVVLWGLDSFTGAWMPLATRMVVV